MKKEVIFESTRVNGVRVLCNNVTFYGVIVIELHTDIYNKNMYVLINCLGDLIAIFHSDSDMVCVPSDCQSFDVELR